MILLYCIHVDTWWLVLVKILSIILTWSVGDTYFPTSVQIPLGCLDLTKRYKFWVLAVSYSADLIRSFLDDIPLPFSLGMSIGSVVITYSISIGTILAFGICPVSSALSLFDRWVPSTQAWWFVPISSRDRGTRCFSWNLSGLLLRMRFWKILMFNKDRINVGRCKLEVSVIPHPVHSCITIQILELHVWTVIVCLVVQRITWL